MKQADNIIGQSGTAPFFRVANPEDVGLTPAPLRHGDAVRTWVSALAGFEKEALVL